MGFGSGFNLPPGCYERDLPGYNDIEVDMDFFCSDCDHEWTESDVTVDERGCDDVEAECPECGKTVSKDYDPPSRWD
jgi:DNA-directed RNA polymerase subunit RPC12/RpoP